MCSMFKGHLTLMANQLEMFVRLQQYAVSLCTYRKTYLLSTINEVINQLKNFLSLYLSTTLSLYLLLSKHFSPPDSFSQLHYISIAGYLLLHVFRFVSSPPH